MRGEKTITFDFPIRYSKGGKFEEAYTITVRAPGLGRIDVYDTMKSYVGKAILNMSKLRSDLRKAVDEDAQAVLESEPNDEAEGEGEDDQKDVLIIMQMGLETEVYTKFVAYVRKVLTNSVLASIGDDGKTKISDEVWEELAEKGGLEAVYMVMSEFVGLFFESLPSPGRSGKKKPTGSDTPAKAISVTGTPKASRSKS